LAGWLEARRMYPRFRILETNSEMSAPEPVAAAAGRLDESSTSQNDEPGDQPGSPTAPITESEVGEYREQDRVLPIANIARIMKNAVPSTSKISKEAKDAVQECVSEFISFITSEAAEKCHEEKRKTIGGEDVLYAMMMLGFEQYVEPLKIYLSKMRQPTGSNPSGLGDGPIPGDDEAETPVS